MVIRSGSRKVNYDVYTWVSDIEREPEPVRPALRSALTMIIERGLPVNIASAEADSYWHMTREIARMDVVGDTRAEIVRDNRFEIIARCLSRA